MGRLRKRSSGKAKINTTRYGRKFKSKYDKDKYAMKMSNIRERWNRKRTVRSNMKRLGLVYDINADIKPYRRMEKMQFMSVDSVVDDNEPMEVVENISVVPDKKKGKRKKSKQAQQLMSEFERRASVPERPRCHLSTADTEYLVNLLKKHGTDYKKMARDKENYNQMTETQLRKKCEQLLASTEARHIKLCKEMGLIPS